MIRPLQWTLVCLRPHFLWSLEHYPTNFPFVLCISTKHVICLSPGRCDGPSRDGQVWGPPMVCACVPALHRWHRSIHCCCAWRGECACFVGLHQWHRSIHCCCAWRGEHLWWMEAFNTYTHSCTCKCTHKYMHTQANHTITPPPNPQPPTSPPPCPPHPHTHTNTHTHTCKHTIQTHTHTCKHTCTSTRTLSGAWHPWFPSL